MTCTQDILVAVGARCFGLVLSTVLALLSWYCLLHDSMSGGFVLSVIAFGTLLLSLFSSGMLVMPVRVFLALWGKIYICLQGAFLLVVFFLIISPLGLAISVFGSEFVSKGQIRRNRKYRNKAPGSYWTTLSDTERMYRTLYRPLSLIIVNEK